MKTITMAVLALLSIAATGRGEIILLRGVAMFKLSSSSFRSIPVAVVAALAIGVWWASPASALTINLFTNGSFTGSTTTYSLVPPGWSNLAQGTIDTVDASGHPFGATFSGIDVVPYTDSSDSGTFVWSGDLNGSSGSQPEGIQQMVLGLSVGQEYEISFEFTNLSLYFESGIATNAFGLQNYNSTGRWLIGVDGSGIGGTSSISPFAVPTTQVWSTYSQTFVATSTSHTFQFTADWFSGVGTHTGMGIDGASLVAVPEPIMGDFDGDFDVDGEDFLLWQLGESPNPLSSSDLADWEANYGTAPIQPGDFDGNGKVNGFDFLFWQRDPTVGSLVAWESHYGDVAPLSATSAAVPEPTTSALALAALCLAMSRRRPY